MDFRRGNDSNCRGKGRQCPGSAGSLEGDGWDEAEPGCGLGQDGQGFAENQIQLPIRLMEVQVNKKSKDWRSLKRTKKVSE